MQYAYTLHVIRCVALGAKPMSYRRFIRTLNRLGF